ncbi:MAG: GatB/YqeY domain-containing protein [Myxococcales bacterium]
MKSRDAAALSALRLLKTEITKKEIELAKKELDDSEILKLVEKALKQRGESAEQFRKGGRTELAEQEEREAAFLKAYLPARLSEQELDALVAQAIAETGAKSPKEMGAVMKVAQAKAAGRADGKALSEVVKKKLANPS